jgi:hypothetical protein
MKLTAFIVSILPIIVAAKPLANLDNTSPSIDINVYLDGKIVSEPL